MAEDTIFALASARGKAGVSIIRISGPAAWAAAERLCRSLPPARQAGIREISTLDGALLDRGLVLAFPEGQSFTGEATVEFQVHGSVAILDAILAELGRIKDLRLAQPGEFTRRALMNGRMDLTQVEALADLIEAETESQRLQAMRVLEGELGRKTEGWRRDLIRAAALIEATIDFADEEVPVDVSPEVTTFVKAVYSDLERELGGARAAERIRDGFEVAIIGAPNAGKSTLLNRLAGREAAITSEIAGTTRDIVEVRMDIDGMAVTFLDTAGLRETEDLIERLGIDRARGRAAQADLRLFLRGPADDDLGFPMRPGDIERRAKGDLCATGQGPAVSGKTGAGVDELLDEISARLATFSAGASAAIRQRHREAMELAVSALSRAEDELRGGPDRSELTAEELRAAIRSLDSLIGKVDVEQLLDEIFASFCLGK